MSLDPHTMSVRRPRETLGGINYNALGHTGIPLPASVMKRSNSISNLKSDGHNAPYTTQHGRSQSSSRMSLMPNRPPQPLFNRSSSGDNLTSLGRSTVQRSSSSNLFASRMSIIPGATTPLGQPSRQSSETLQRRSSVFKRHSTAGPGAHQSFFVQAPLPAGVPQDPRKTRDRNIQNKMSAELEEYLSVNNFQMEMKHALGPNSMRSPTQKDFTMIFQWLYKRIDPGYVFQKGMDTEVPPILKQLRYPYEKSITKSQLTAVGGNNWHVFLAMLHWMMQLAEMMRRFDDGHYDDACAERGVDVSGDRIIFRFLSGAYQTWLSCPAGEDEDEAEADRMLLPHVEAMAAEFERGNRQYVDELKMLEAEHEALKDQIEALEKEIPDLAQHERMEKAFQSDIEIFTDFAVKATEKSRRVAAKNEALEKDVKSWDEQLEEATKETSELQAALDQQGISIQEIDYMSNERERLQKGCDSARTRLEEVTARIKEMEAEANNKLNELELLARQYNNLCYSVGLRDPEFELHLKVHEAPFASSQMGSSPLGSNDRLLADDGTGYQPAQIVNLDLRNKVKAALVAERRKISQRRNDAKDEAEAKEQLLADVAGAIEENNHEVEALQHKVHSAKQECQETNANITTQKLASDAQIEKMEKEMAKMRAGLMESVQLMEQREMNTNIEYEQLTVRANTLREELHTEIERMLNDIIKFKVHIQKSLEDYEGFVVEEVEQELGGEMEMEV